jgi:hypothetical protein
MAQITNSFPFEFYGTTIEVHMADDAHWYIRLDHMCEHLGLDSNSQRRKLQEHPAIGDRCVPILIDTPYRNSTRKQEVWFLDIHILHLWLGMIQVLKVREELRERLIFYQRDLAQSLWLLYRSETFPKEILDEINASMSPNDRQVAEIFEAAQELRRKVDILNGHLDEELSRLGLVIGNLDNRLGAVETKIIGEETINSQQAKQSRIWSALWLTLYISRINQSIPSPRPMPPYTMNLSNSFRSMSTVRCPRAASMRPVISSVAGGRSCQNAALRYHLSSKGVRTRCYEMVGSITQWDPSDPTINL